MDTMLLAHRIIMFSVGRSKSVRLRFTAAPLLCLLVICLVLAAGRSASAQYLSSGGAPPGGSRPFSVALAPQLPGSLWLSVTGARYGLGYNDSYFSLGGKQRLFQGPLEGRWLTEVHAHVVERTGKPLANFGFERVKTLDPIGVDYGLNIWFDIDDDQLEHFGHTFYQVGVGGFVKTRYFDIRGNGYIPAGDTGFKLPLESCFFQNHIVVQGGLDAALEGFDTEIRFRPARLAMQYGYVDFGGYYYNSADNLINAFSGLRTRVGLSPVPGIGLSFELNNDSRFNTTGFLRVEFAFGGAGDRAHGDAAATSRDLERTVRNDHIVRFQEDVEFAIDPDTRLPYFVYHVDNTAGIGGDGSAGRPYDTLIYAELASSADDIIFVREGDGTFNGMNAGILLKDGQLLLGDGVAHDIPLLGGGTFLLCNDIDGNKPTISNGPGLNVVTLADRNTVAGFNIDGEDLAMHGIFGDGWTVTDGAITNTIIRDNMIFDVVEDGIQLRDIDGGVWYDIDGAIVDDQTTLIKDNMILNVGDDAIDIFGVVNTLNRIDILNNDITNSDDEGIVLGSVAGENSVYFFNNTIIDTGSHGIHVMDVSDTPVPLDGGTWDFYNNTIIDSGGHGVLLEGFVDSEATLLFEDNRATDSGLDGIHLQGVRVMTLTFTDNVTNDNNDDGLNLVSIGDPIDPLFSVDVDIQRHTSSDNIGDGIAVDRGNGNLTITSASITMNNGDGIDIDNFTNNVEGTSTTISDSTITGNGTGAAAGINYFLDVPSTPPPNQEETLVITGNTIDNNGVNVMVVAADAGTVLDTDIVDNPSISGFASDGINLQSLSGATQTINVQNNLISGIPVSDPNDPNAITGLSTGGALRLIVNDFATGEFTTMTGTVANNTITNPGGEGVDRPPDLVGISGISIDAIGESFFDVTFDTNEIMAGLGNDLAAQFNVSQTTDINRLDLFDNTFTGTGGDDTIIIQSMGMTLLDMEVRGNKILNAAQTGLTMNLLDDTLTRAVFENNEWIDTSGDPNDAEADNDSRHGFLAEAGGSARLLLTFSGNTIHGYGQAGELEIEPQNPDWGEGFSFSAIETSVVSIRAINNVISESALEGMRLELNDEAIMNAVVLDNNFRNNDLAFSDPNEPQFERDVIIDRLSADSTLCLALHNNFANTGEGFLIRTAAGDPNDPNTPFIPVLLEQGLNTPVALTDPNDPNDPNIVFTTFDPVASTCIMNVDAEEAVFSAAGFP